MIGLNRLNLKTDWLYLAGIMILPFRPAISVALFIVGVIAEKILSRQVPFFRFEYKPFALALAGYYFLHVLGMSYTDNIPFGVLDLQIKASFLLLPLIAMIVGQPSTDKSTLGLFWVIGAVIAGSVCLMKALPVYFSDPRIAHITYAEFCFFSHPTYLSLFLSAGLFILMSNDSGSVEVDFSIGRLTIVFLLCLYILLSQSRTGIAVTFFLLIFNLWSSIKPGRRSRLRAFIPVLTALVLYSVLSMTSGDDRMNSLVREVTKDGPVHKDSVQYSATDTRFRIWTTATDASSDHLPFGAGTGDAKDVLLKEYESKGFDDLLAKAYNAHNQYLQTALALGVIGVLSLILVFVFAGYGFVGSGRIFGIQVVLAFAMNCLTECIFEVQSGVIMFAGFLFLFLNKARVKTGETAR